MGKLGQVRLDILLVENDFEYQVIYIIIYFEFIIIITNYNNELSIP